MIKPRLNNSGNSVVFDASVVSFASIVSFSIVSNVVAVADVVVVADAVAVAVAADVVPDNFLTETVLPKGRRSLLQFFQASRGSPLSIRHEGQIIVHKIAE